MAKSFVAKDNTVKINGILEFDGDKIIFSNEDDPENKVELKNLISDLEGFSLSVSFKKNEVVI